MRTIATALITTFMYVGCAGGRGDESAAAEPPGGSVTRCSSAGRRGSPST